MSAPEWVALALGCCAALEDLWRRRISNPITAAGLAAGLGLGLAGGGWRGLGSALAGAALGFCVFLLFHGMGGMGAGDLKLMAAFGALLGPAGILMAAVLAAMAGALLAAAVLLWRPRAAAIPYAPAIVAGAWLAMLGRR
jgi:prepilin peptidase CpaA